MAKLPAAIHRREVAKAVASNVPQSRRDKIAIIVDDSIAVHEIRRMLARHSPGDWTKAGDVLTDVSQYTHGYGARVYLETLELLRVIASDTRFEIPSATAGAISNCARDILSSILLSDVRTPIASAVEICEAAAEIGGGIAYDGSLKLGDISVTLHGTKLLMDLQWFAQRLSAAKLQPIVDGAFELARDGATRSSIAKEALALVQHADEQGRHPPGKRERLPPVVSLAMANLLDRKTR